MWSGPAESTPVWENGGDSVTWKDGSGAAGGLGMKPATRHTTVQELLHQLPSTHYPVSGPQLCQCCLDATVHDPFMAVPNNETCQNSDPTISMHTFCEPDAVIRCKE